MESQNIMDRLHDKNPITDKGTSLPSKILAIISLLLVPLLFIVCNPSRDWVKKTVKGECK